MDNYTSDLETYRINAPGLDLAATGWSWRGARFANNPGRRVAAAHALPVGSASPLGHAVLGALSELPPDRTVVALRSLVARDGSPYWCFHTDFSTPLRRPAALIGSQRASDITVNALLPWALAVAHRLDNEALQATVIRAYQAHPPLASNQITGHMAFQVLGERSGSVVTNACRQQGLLQPYRGWCECRDCASCPAGQNAAT